MSDTKEMENWQKVLLVLYEGGPIDLDRLAVQSDLSLIDVTNALNRLDYAVRVEDGEWLLTIEARSLLDVWDGLDA